MRHGIVDKSILVSGTIDCSLSPRRKDGRLLFFNIDLTLKPKP